MYPFVVVDKQVGGFAALRQSWRLTQKNRLKILAFSIMLMIAMSLLTLAPMGMAALPILIFQEHGILPTIVIGLPVLSWLIALSIACGSFTTTAYALMYKKMTTTRKIAK